ncbi:MAG TPA: PEP-CTERM sorting domain-containing protein [Verrucomicrobiae bacterium]|nr:PEP-CTERM sorting domain-containing protein [Verrucomicrobiae bacterium]
MHRSRLPALYFCATLALMTGAAQAQYSSGDLIIGFTSGSGNDLVYDLGRVSNFTSSQSWNLNSALTSSPGSYSTLGNLNFGAVGALSLGLSGASKNVWSTVPAGQGAPVNIPNAATFNQIKTSIDTIGQFITSGSAGIDAASDPASWNGETIVGGSGTYFNNYGSATVNNPNSTTPATFNSGSVVEDLYAVTANNTAGTLVGTLSFDPSGTVTFNASPVPEPSSIALVGLFGVLAVALRRRSSARASS